MNVLYLTASPFFDLEISLIRELSKLVNVKVLMIVNKNSMQSSAFSLSELGDETCIKNFTEVAELSKYSKMINLSSWYLAINSTNSLVDSFRLGFKIKEFLAKNHFDVIHNTTFSKELVFTFPFLRSIRNRVMTVHDPIPHDKVGYVERFRILFYQRFFKNRILLSPALLDEYLSFSGFSADTIFFSRLSVYDFLTQYDITPNLYGNYILFFGRITHYKGVELLIEAYRKSELKKKGIKLVIAGKGKLTCDLPNQEDGIIFINRYIDNAELASLIRWSSFIVLPYLSATQSGCVMSAYAFNKPILATHVGDLPKEIEHGKTGFIVQPNSLSELIEGLNNMIDERRLSSMTQNIENKYKHDGLFSWSAAAQQIVNSYNKIIS